MPRQDSLFINFFVGEKPIGGVRIGPIFASERDTFFDAFRQLPHKLPKPISKLLFVPVRVSDTVPAERDKAVKKEAGVISPGAILIEFGNARADRRRSGPREYPRRTGQLAPVISLPAGTSIWITAGVADMRRGFTGLSAVAQTVLEQNLYSGHVFVFRGKRGDLIKLLWDGDGLCLFAKRLERGGFVWPQAKKRRRFTKLGAALDADRLAKADPNSRASMAV